jgi:hypothetical protein
MKLGRHPAARWRLQAAREAALQAARRSGAVGPRVEPSEKTCGATLFGAVCSEKGFSVYKQLVAGESCGGMHYTFTTTRLLSRAKHANGPRTYAATSTARWVALGHANAAATSGRPCQLQKE